MDLATTKGGGMVPWPTFHKRYQAAAVAAMPKLTRCLWQIAADDLERICNPATLADVAGCLAAFEAALRAEEVDAESLAIYLAMIGDALAWGRGEGRVAA
jgi:hypothetical protein